MQTGSEPTIHWPDKLTAPTVNEVHAALCKFWPTLATIGDLVDRAEWLLLHAQINALRRLIIDMMLAANGIRYPTDTQHLNLYLGESQRRVLEKTLRAAPLVHETETPNGTHHAPGEHPLAANSIAQAVALVVIYRWYAPQLVARYECSYPSQAEADALHTLNSSIPTWPRAIKTD